VRILRSLLLAGSLITGVFVFASPALSARPPVPLDGGFPATARIVFAYVPTSHRTIDNPSTGVAEQEVVNAYELPRQHFANVLCTSKGHRHTCTSVTTCSFSSPNVIASCTVILTDAQADSVLTASYTNTGDGVITGGTGQFHYVTGTYRSTNYRKPAVPSQITFEVKCTSAISMCQQ